MLEAEVLFPLGLIPLLLLQFLLGDGGCLGLLIEVVADKPQQCWDKANAKQRQHIIQQLLPITRSGEPYQFHLKLQDCIS